MDILLHLGAHRCASTTFQSYLSQHRVVLSRQGLTCWTPERTRDGMMHGLVRDPRRITIQDERDGLRSLGRMRAEMDRLARMGQRAVLISEENMIGAVRSNLREAALYPLLSERLMRFAPAFAGRRMTIGLCIRRYDDFWTSGLQYRLMQGGRAPTTDALDFLTTQPRSWRHVIREIAGVFPDADLLVMPFERVAAAPDTQLRVLQQGFGGTPPAAGDTWRNRSAPLARLNKVMVANGGCALDGGAVDPAARWMPFDGHQRTVLHAQYRRDLTWLRAGAQGLATFHEGRAADATLINKTGDGRKTPAPCPDRANVTRMRDLNAVLFGGRHDGIEKGLGRPGAS